MRVYGIDFNCAPSARKPITCALCRLEDDRLYLDALRADRLRQRYGLRLFGLRAFVDEFAEDERGGAIDALMCAVQAAWAWTRRDAGFGIPQGTDLNEGWIADPATSAATIA